MNQSDLLHCIGLVLAVIAFYWLVHGMANIRTWVLTRRILKRGGEVNVTEADADGFAQKSAFSLRLIREVEQPPREIQHHV